MTSRLLRYTVLPLLAATLCSTALAHTQHVAHPVGWNRVVRSAMPRPIPASGGGVYVPTDLRLIPTLDFDSGVVDDGAEGDLGGVRARPTSMTPVEVATVGANVRLNNTAGDPAGTTNAETSIAAHGSQIVGGWNDGLNFGVSPGNSGYAYSSNGGATFTDGGVPPVPAGSNARYEGDPSLTVDNAGNFYYANLYTPDGSLSGISVNRGNFSGASFSWNLPTLPVTPTATDFLDKEWIAADPVNGNVYLTYTRFLAAGGNQIEFTRSTNQGATWDPPTVLTSSAVENCTGSRVQVGPSGEIQVIYFVFDVASSNNYMRTRRSTTQGTSWGPEITLPTGPSGIISNYGSGPAGFNRARGIGFPSLAIDRSGGLHNGRVYATWEETFNFYFDALGAAGTVNETEGNNTPATANPITIGQTINGTMANTADQDWFSFTGTAGQNVILYLTPGTGDGFIRLFAGGAGNVANRAMLSYIGFGTGLVVYTLPATGTYYFRILANSATVGTYTVYTGYHTPVPGDEVGRDTRDAILQYSDDGLTWNTRKVVNDDPVRFDNAFPEVAVNGIGQVFTYWMDHRNDGAGINADFYYDFSNDGGLTFAPSARVNDGPSINWNNVASNLAPNLGDYQGMTADGCFVYANFADGRSGNSPDSYMAPINECSPTPTLVSLVEARALPDRVHLEWYAASDVAVLANVYRQSDSGPWVKVGSVASGGTGTLVFEDSAVQAGASYGYRLGILGAGGETAMGETRVQVPARLELALNAVTPNPSPAGFEVSFALPNGAPATLDLVDVAGRVVKTANVGVLGAGMHRVHFGGDGSLQPGMYLVRLSQAGHRIGTKVALIR